jgi:hypothetical protein
VRLLLCLIIISFGLFAEPNPAEKNPSPDTSLKKTETDKDTSKLQNSTAPSNESNLIEELDLDKDFYNRYYILNHPTKDSEDIIRKENEILNTNLIKSFKSEIVLRDSPNCQRLLPDINVATVRIKNVSKDSIWMKKIRKEVGYISFTEHMYIIKYQNYLALILYEIDPRKHILSPNQIELIINKEVQSK